MFDPQSTRKNSNRYYTKKGQINQATITNVPLVINPRHVDAYLEYMLANGIVSNKDDTPRPSPVPTPDLNPQDYLGVHYIRNNTSQPLYFYFDEIGKITFLNPGQNITISPAVPPEILSELTIFFFEGEDIYLNNFSDEIINDYFLVRNNNSESPDTRIDPDKQLGVGMKHYYKNVNQGFISKIYSNSSNVVKYIGFRGLSDEINYNVNYDNPATVLYAIPQSATDRDVVFSLEQYFDTNRHRGTIAVFCALPSQ